MNEQLPIQLSLDISLPERAQRIRDLVGVARTCIIEIGRELIAAKAQVGHGEWLPWVEAEFGWTDRTAQKYMTVADAFKNERGSDFAGLTIDATALYALSEETVSPEVRAAVIERAQAGEHITKADADELITNSVKAAVEGAIKVEREAVALALREKETEAEGLRAQIEELEAGAGLKEAALTLSQLQDAYDAVTAELDAARAELANPTDEQVVRVIALLGGKKKPGRMQLVAIASALGRPITFSGKEYQPVAEAELADMRREKAIADERLKKLHDPNGGPAKWHKALMALRALNQGAQPVEILMADRYDGFDHVFADELPKARAWINELSRKMGGKNVG